MASRDVLRESVYSARLECLRRRIRVNYSRLVLSHPAVFASAFAFAFAFATFLPVAPRLILLRLLAVGFVFSSYFEDSEVRGSGHC